SLDAGAPAGAAINPTTGAFTWTPAEADGPGAFAITIRVTDDGAPALDDFETITVNVAEVNAAPVLAAIGNQSVNEGAALTFTASATDADLPANTLTFSLDAGAPAAASINPATGAFAWTPAEADGPGSFAITIRVTDDGAPALDDFETITVNVAEVNAAPAANGDTFTVTEDALAVPLDVRANDTDGDLPANALTITGVSAPANGTAATDGVTVIYTPSANYVGLDTFTYTLSDGAGGAATGTITLTVTAVNDAPTANAGPDQTVNTSAAVSLDGGASFDGDGPLPLAFGWQQTGGPAVSLSDPAAAQPTFTAPAAPAVLTFTLTVTDALGLASAPDDVIVSVGEIAIAELTAASDGPTVVGAATNFTATLTAGSNVSYAWDFGDGAAGSGATASHTYAAAGVYTAVVTASNSAGSATASVTVVVVVIPTTGGQQLFLPLVMNNYSAAPDLVSGLSFSPAAPAAGQPVTVSVVITNQGAAPAVNFWVDLYLDPSAAPTQAGAWDTRCAADPCYGIAWFVAGPLAPGQSLTLTSTPDSYVSDNTIWPGSLPAGTRAVYVYVDSFSNVGNPAGTVLESDETNNRAEWHSPDGLTAAETLSASEVPGLTQPLAPRSEEGPLP
ncbi:MAG: tandem-95 repeat protein, partial [Anaerolineales bacterium]|nr:tandem-95 repeat protein [Anaerolineales bacterium]